MAVATTVKAQWGRAWRTVRAVEMPPMAFTVFLPTLLASMLLGVVYISLPAAYRSTPWQPGTAPGCYNSSDELFDARPDLLPPQVRLGAASAVDKPDRVELADGELRDAALLFNAVHHSMRQVGNSLAPNGLSFVPARIPAGTLLFHGRGNASVPQGLEWLAFDVEYSYSMAAMGGGTPDNHYRPPESERHSFMLTFSNPQALERVLVIDGLSAALTATGTLDSQDLLIEPVGEWNEYARAKGLCEWGKKFGVPGFVRINTGFELLWCDFQDGQLDLVDQLDMDRSFYGSRELSTSGFRWMQAAASHYRGSGEARVEPDFSLFTSAYGRTNDSASAAYGKVMFPDNVMAHRLADVPADVQAEWRAETEEVVTKYGTGRSIPWRTVTDQIVAKYASVLKLLFDNGVDEAGKIAAKDAIGRFSSVPTDSPATDRAATLARCEVGFTRQFLGKDLTKYDQRIMSALTRVQNEICTLLLDVEAGALSDEVLLTSVSRLLYNLDWSVYYDCPEACEADELCYVPMWPMGWNMGFGPPPYGGPYGSGPGGPDMPPPPDMNGEAQMDQARPPPDMWVRGLDKRALPVMTNKPPVRVRQMECRGKSSFAFRGPH
ncbi:uncharacterized protein V1510DRAFT_404744 [Dipodascopsis tothii]|uniref:uncharacterized protein n=1 Tax=Dipodascopsis tothii TaxID=44089 RepID=UPI0034CEBA71